MFHSRSVSAEPMKVTTMDISLPGEFARYVREKVEGGHYSSVRR